MRICLVSPKFLWTDGQGRVNSALARHLARRHHQILLIGFAIAPDLLADPNIMGLEIASPKGLKGDLLKNQYFAIQSRKLLRQHRQQFDVLHSNGCLTYFPADVNASHFVHSTWNKSAYHPSKTFGGLYGLYQKWFTQINAFWEKQAYSSAQYVVAVSDFVRDSLIADAGVTANKVFTIMNGVDTDEFRPLAANESNSLRAELGLDADQFIVFFTGGIRTNRKNLDLVMKALAQLAPSYHLVVAGDAKDSPYQDLAKSLRIGSRVHFLGHRSDVSTLLRCANAFAFPSHYDPCPLSLLEALASALPTITTPMVGNSTLIQSGVNGYILADGNDLEGLIQALRQLGEQPDEAHTLGLTARTTAQQYSWEKMALRYEQLYQTALAKPDLIQPQPVSQAN